MCRLTTTLKRASELGAERLAIEARQGEFEETHLIRDELAIMARHLQGAVVAEPRRLPYVRDLARKVFVETAEHRPDLLPQLEGFFTQLCAN